MKSDSEGIFDPANPVSRRGRCQGLEGQRQFSADSGCLIGFLSGSAGIGLESVNRRTPTGNYSRRLYCRYLLNGC